MSSKHLEDLNFLQQVKDASYEELQRLKANHRHSTSPKWKQVVIDRAIAKATKPD